MKNQYLCDINDYRKYGLLRAFAPSFRICVAWMLTHDDGGQDGNKRKYLGEERREDADLFAGLREIHDTPGRSVADIESSGLIPRACFHADLVPRKEIERERYIEALLRAAEQSELVFFDPDNGLEVKSCPRGRKNAPKYVYWDELKRFWTVQKTERKSLLVYQHFPRKKRSDFIAQISQTAATHLPNARVVALVTGHVAFFLFVHPDHAAPADEALRRLEEKWSHEIRQEVP